MNARALGREKVWQALSSSAKYASVSTIVPAQVPQINSAPTSSRAHRIGSRRKKVARMIRLLTVGTGSRRRIGYRQKLLETLCLVINWDLHFTSYRFSVSERRNEFRFAHVLEGGIAESEKWR